jgi:hypothetical protein
MPPPVMRSSFASSRQSRDSKGRKLKLSREYQLPHKQLRMLIINNLERGDPEKRPILTRIYGMIGCLIVSLVLIVILIILQKKLPDGAGSYFHIPVRRDLEAISARESAQRQEDGLRGTLNIPFPYSLIAYRIQWRKGQLPSHFSSSRGLPRSSQ